MMHHRHRYTGGVTLAVMTRVPVIELPLQSASGMILDSRMWAGGRA